MNPEPQRRKRGAILEEEEALDPRAKEMSYALINRPSPPF